MTWQKSVLCRESSKFDFKIMEIKLAVSFLYTKTFNNFEKLLVYVDFVISFFLTVIILNGFLFSINLQLLQI